MDESKVSGWGVNEAAGWGWKLVGQMAYWKEVQMAELKGIK